MVVVVVVESRSQPQSRRGRLRDGSTESPHVLETWSGLQHCRSFDGANGRTGTYLNIKIAAKLAQTTLVAKSMSTALALVGVQRADKKRWVCCGRRADGQS